MTTHKVAIEVRLDLLSPLHIGVGYGVAGFLDSRVLADADGSPYVPGSSLKGRLRYYLDGLPSAVVGPRDKKSAIVNLFGEEDRGGSLVFLDLKLDHDWKRPGSRSLAQGTRAGDLTWLGERRTNVMLSRRRGVALERRLFTYEATAEGVSFRGTISGVVPDEARIIQVQDNVLPRDIVFLLLACRSLTHIGGRKSRGLGRAELIILNLNVNGVSYPEQSILETLV